MQVGFIGLGRMGMPMSKNLLKAGFQLTVHNRSQGKVEEMAGLGATPASSPAKVTQASDIVLTCLPDVPTVEQLFLGEDGIVANARPGQVLVDHSTIGPSTARKISKAADAKGAFFLDAPVSGFPVGATNATLTIMVGGDQAAYEKSLPVFQAMGNNIQHMGLSGAGSTMKLVNQLILCINAVGAAEGFLLGVRLGIDPQVLLDTVSKSSGQSAALSMLGPVLMSRNFSGDIVQLQVGAKDVGLVQEVAREVGVPLLLGNEMIRVFEEAISMGLGEHGPGAILLVLEELADKQASG